ncbi:hypothetical protein TNCV_2489041 [Trichonephila clavipes]|nr:hypothetical protein TNCV_2489041 [Trichonephila clavipes]
MFLVRKPGPSRGIDPRSQTIVLLKTIESFPYRNARRHSHLCKNEIVHHRVPLPNLQRMDATAVQIKVIIPPINVVSAYVQRRAGHSFPVRGF